MRSKDRSILTKFSVAVLFLLIALPGCNSEQRGSPTEGEPHVQTTSLQTQQNENGSTDGIAESVSKSPSTDDLQLSESDVQQAIEKGLVSAKLLAEQRDQLDQTLWAPEVDAQRYEEALSLIHI